MEIVFLLIIISLGFAGLIATVLFWAIRSGQFDDLEKEGHQILMDDDDIELKQDPQSKNNKTQE